MEHSVSSIDIDINELTSGFNEAIRSTATETLGKQRKKKQPWITNDILDLCDKRRELKKDKYNSQDAAEQYKITNKNVRSKMNNIPAELLKYGGKELVALMTSLCQKIWETKTWPDEWTRSLIIPLPEKGNPRKCQNYRTKSLICHSSKVILNRLKNEAEEHLAEEQARFRPGRSPVEQIFNCRIMMEKHLQHQRELFHNFIDFKKAFDRVWHHGLWHALCSFGIEEGLVQIMKSLYSSASSAVLLNNNVSNYFRTTVSVRQGCLFSPILFNL